jgi:hypothetical protein
MCPFIALLLCSPHCIHSLALIFRLHLPSAPSAHPRAQEWSCDRAQSERRRQRLADEPHWLRLLACDAATCHIAGKSSVSGTGTGAVAATGKSGSSSISGGGGNGAKQAGDSQSARDKSDATRPKEGEAATSRSYVWYVHWHWLILTQDIDLIALFRVSCCCSARNPILWDFESRLLAALGAVAIAVAVALLSRS